jgi:hypothetical protein
MNASEVAKWITDARFAPYLAESHGDYDDALALYIWNVRISAAAFETLHHVEVLVRNSVDVQFTPVDLSARPEDTWLDNPSILIGPARDRVRTTIDRIVRDGKRPTRGRVVAGLSFGFWRALFDKKYQQLWNTHLHRAFPAGSGDRSEVAALMSNLVPFRNRLAHHETIVRRPIAEHYEEMLALAGLVDAEARGWIRTVSRVESVLAARPGSSAAPNS